MLSVRNFTKGEFSCDDEIFTSNDACTFSSVLALVVVDFTLNLDQVIEKADLVLPGRQRA